MAHTLPNAQMVFAVVPAGQLYPLGHATCDKVLAHSLPARHRDCAADPCGQKYESVQAVGADTPRAHLEPAGQIVGTELAAGQKLDAGHCIPTDDPTGQ